MSVAMGSRNFLTQLHGSVGVGGPIFVTAAVALEPWQQNIHCTANTASGDYTINMPPVAECKGMLFTFHTTIANAKTVTVKDAGGTVAESEDWTNLTLDADNDSATLYSDGRKWHLNSSEIA